jgi:acyl-CoA thioester hydrolase
MEDFPMQKTDFVHFYGMAVRWGDLDVLGHVNNAELIRYLECGRIAYCDEVLNLRFTPFIDDGWILADLQCIFHRQLRYPAAIAVGTRISRLSNRSIELTGAIFLGDELILSARVIGVWFDYKAQKSKPIPDEVRAAVRAFEKIQPEEAV